MQTLRNCACPSCERFGLKQNQTAGLRMGLAASGNGMGRHIPGRISSNVGVSNNFMFGFALVMKSSSPGSLLTTN
jgi:hypothetical protein